ncbi:MAG: agmatinase [Candidatus Nealsonbacteria bacterium]
MKKHYQTWPFNFGAIHSQDFKKAKVVVVPVPYEGTVSFNGGTRNGPYAIINNSRYLDELFDSQGDDLIGLKSTDIFTLDELELSANSPREAVEGVQQAIEEEVLKYNKIPLMLGGEHSITFGAVSALKKKYSDLSVLQLDAHADLIDEYVETKYSHACVMRRIRESGVKAVQVGIRNLNTEIKDYFKDKKSSDIYFAPNIPTSAILKGLSKNVYLTVDVDVFDPSIMPSTGTPEPGGLGWYEVLNLIEKVAKTKNIVGVDVVELAPIPGFVAPDFLAAKLVYKIISYIVK